MSRIFPTTFTPNQGSQFFFILSCQWFSQRLSRNGPGVVDEIDAIAAASTAEGAESIAAMGILGLGMVFCTQTIFKKML